MPAQSDELIAQAREARRARRTDDAKRDLLQAIDLLRRDHEQLKLAAALEGLGQIERDLHHLDAARQHYEEAAAIFAVGKYELGLAHAIRHVADIHREAGSIELAESSYNHALWLYRDIPDATPLELANAIRGLAILKSDSGQFDRARELWTEARNLYAAANVQAGVDESTHRLELLSKKSAT